MEETLCVQCLREPGCSTDYIFTIVFEHVAYSDSDFTAEEMWTLEGTVEPSVWRRAPLIPTPRRQRQASLVYRVSFGTARTTENPRPLPRKWREPRRMQGAYI